VNKLFSFASLTSQPVSSCSETKTEWKVPGVVRAKDSSQKYNAVRMSSALRNLNIAQ
jgi:hypothetical protein